MKYRLLGGTGLLVSVLGYGASSLAAHLGSAREAEIGKAIKAAVANGVNFFDVCPFWGKGAAENYLGKALRKVPRKQYYLTTKVGRYWNAQQKSFDYSAARVLRSVDESMARLGVDYLDIVQVQDVEFADRQQLFHETLPALKNLKDCGKIHFIGITGLSLDVLEELVEEAGEDMVDTVQSFCHYNLVDDSLLDKLMFFDVRRKGLINSAPLATGLLSEKGVPQGHPAGKEQIRVCRQAVKHCEKRGSRLEKLALQYAIRNPRIATTLLNTTSSIHMTRNLNWLEEPMDELLLEQVKEILKPVYRMSWENV